MEYTLKLTDQDLQVINQIVANQPYSLVAPLVAKINSQINEQIKEKES